MSGFSEESPTEDELAALERKNRFKSMLPKILLSDDLKIETKKIQEVNSEDAKNLAANPRNPLLKSKVDDSRILLGKYGGRSKL